MLHDDRADTALSARPRRSAPRRRARAAGARLRSVAEGTVRRAVAVRITGLAAEMTYYALVSLVPLLTAIGAGLGFLERLLGGQRVTDIEAALIDALGVVFAPEVTTDVIAPIVRDVLHEERTVLAVGGAMVALLLAARMFRSAGAALDTAYGVARPRTGVASWLVATLLALAATVVVTVTLTAVVVGPLLGGGQAIADTLALGQAFEFVWDVGRWPAVFLIGVVFLAALYQLAPAAGYGWRASLPGAVVATAGIVLVTLGVRGYFALVGAQTFTPEEPGEAVALVGQVLGGLLVAALWAWLTNVVVLLGGVLNAQIAATRRPGL